MELILDFRRSFDRKSNKTHFPLEFKVEREISQIMITLIYNPKRATAESDLRLATMNGIDGATEDSEEAFRFVTENDIPIHNLVSISLFKDGEYLGCGHRHDMTSIVRIGRKGVTNGFILPENMIGDYRTVLSFHGLFTESLDVELTVEVE